MSMTSGIIPKLWERMRFSVMATGIKGTNTIEYQWDLCS